MKTKLLLAICLLTAAFAFGQNETFISPKNPEEVKVTPPKFTGVQNVTTLLNEGRVESIQEYLAKNVIYPEEDAKKFNQGTEVVQFTVTTTGEVSDFVIINGLSTQIDEEVIRVLQTTKGMWVPGYNDGNPVEMEKEVSVTFKINGISHPLDFEEQATKYFVKGSELLLTENKPKKALKYYDKAIQLLPNDKCLLLNRGFARYGTGNLEGAMRDWDRLKYIGGTFDEEYLTNLSGLDGYAELIHILNEQIETNKLAKMSY